MPVLLHARANIVCRRGEKTVVRARVYDFLFLFLLPLVFLYIMIMRILANENGNENLDMIGEGGCNRYHNVRIQYT